MKKNLRFSEYDTQENDMRTLEVKNDSLSEMEKYESMEHGVDGK